MDNVWIAEAVQKVHLFILHQSNTLIPQLARDLCSKSQFVSDMFITWRSYL